MSDARVLDTGLPATEIAATVRAGDASAREVVEAHLARIAVVNGRLNAITVVLDEQALAAADAIDHRIAAGADPGPLAGVPLTVKENVDVAGSATTLGIAPLRDAIATQDAAHVAQLRDAGAIVIGRTNMPELGMRWHTDNALRGATRNPWSAAHTPGASSGGDAAAVASGMAALGIGNDGAGSLRWPAQCCGVAALKPSFGRIGSVATTPPPFAFQLLAVHGPLARSIADLRLAFAHMCAAVDANPWHVPAPLDGPPLPRRAWLVVPSDVHPDVADALQRASVALRDAGYDVEEAEPPELARASQLYIQIMTRFGVVDDGATAVEAIASPDFVRFWKRFAPSWERAAGTPSFDPLAERTALFRAWAAWMRERPLVLAPIATQPAFPVGADLDDAWIDAWPTTIAPATLANLLGLPAVAIPTGVHGGLPHAVQVIGPRLREDACLDAAQTIEDRLGAPGVAPDPAQAAGEPSAG